MGVTAALGVWGTRIKARVSMCARQVLQPWSHILSPGRLSWWDPGPLFPLRALCDLTPCSLCFVALDTRHACFGSLSSSSLPRYSSSLSELIPAPETETSTSRLGSTSNSYLVLHFLTLHHGLLNLQCSTSVYFLACFFCVYLLRGHTFPNGRAPYFAH